MKAWRNTALRFGLVSVAVSLAPARDTKPALQAHTYDASDLQPVKQAWQRDDNGKLAKETVKAYAVDPDAKPKVIDKPELAGDVGIDLQAFVNVTDVDPVWYDDCYAVWPAKGGEQGLGLVAALLQESASVLVAQARFTDRPRTCVLRWSQALGSVVLHTLHYADALRVADASTASESLQHPDAALREQGAALLDALPADWQPIDSDPMQAAIASALGMTPAAGDDGDAAPVEGADLMAALSATYDALQADAAGDDGQPNGQAQAQAKVAAGS